MGPRQQVTLDQRPTQDHRDQRRKRLGPTQQKAGQQAEADRECRGGQEHQPAPAGEVIDGRQDDFGEPFVRHPNGTGKRVGKRIVQRQGVVREHPATRGDVEIGVGVVEQRPRLSERPNEKSEPDDQRPGRNEFPECREDSRKSSNSNPDLTRLIPDQARWIRHLWLAGFNLVAKMASIGGVGDRTVNYRVPKTDTLPTRPLATPDFVPIYGIISYYQLSNE